MRVWVLVFALAALAQPVAAQGLVERPVWVKQPFGTLPSSFPIEDFRANVELECAVADGALVGCSPVSETPRRFLDAAIAAASEARLADADADGAPTNMRRIRVSIQFPGIAIDPPPPPPPARMISNPRWLAEPSAEDMARHYPAQALARRINGRVTLHCFVVRNSYDLACVVEQARPANRGFEEAGVAVARYFRIAPEDADGQPTAGGAVRVQLNFDARGGGR